MIRSLIATAVLSAVVTPPANDNPSDALWTAFQSSCVANLQSFEAAKARILAGGWTRIELNREPRLAGAVAGTYASDESDDGIREFYGQVTNGRKLYLYLTESNGPVTLMGCFLYDLDPPASVSSDPLTAWVGEPPQEHIGTPSEFEALNWYRPASMSAVWGIRYGVIRPATPAAEEMGFSGRWLGVVSITGTTH